jgi:hypothetical protein
MNIQNNFIRGRMNKSLDERLLPPGEYRDAYNIEVSSVEGNNIGAVKNVRGNTQLVTLEYDGESLSADAVCIGAASDDAKGVIYWFVHDPVVGVDMIVSYNEKVSAFTYHVISLTVLNFNPQYLITGVDIIDDLLIWTDNYNQPRKINVNRSYPAPLLGNDAITEADIALILAPPIEAPTVLFKNVDVQENFINDKFVCFAYRYKYQDGEYSALSQFSNAAFIPGLFSFGEESTSNDGMTNVFNAVEISFNAGSNNVVGIDLCFKLNDSNVINVIEKFDKYEQNWGDFTTQTVTFSNNKIYTTLPESELLRVYDNVPRMAKAQTIMGNRLMYGNYVDGYNIEDSDSQPITIDFEAEGVSQEYESNDVTTSILPPGVVYTITPNAPAGMAASVAAFNFTPITINEGDVFQFKLKLSYLASDPAGFEPFPGVPAVDDFYISFSVQALNDYATTTLFVASTEFQNALGTAANVRPISESCFGFTMGDSFGCNSPRISGWQKYTYGITGGTPTVPQPPIATAVGATIRVQIPAMVYQNETTSAFMGIYFNISEASATYDEFPYNRSLHSNRGYDVAVVYMDDFGRNTTALICENSSVFFGANASATINRVKVTINNVAPSWATRYKFVMRQSRGAYEVVYSNRLFYSATAGYWLELTGDNQQKVQKGDLIIVKKDYKGVVNDLVQIEVLDIQSQPAGFISPSPTPIGAPGLYMNINVNGLFSVPPTNGYMASPMVFETQPAEVNDSIYYEGSQSFSIVNGLHRGNVQDQSALQPAIVDLDFFNCYTFGNGVESNKYLDQLIARSIVLGNRFSAVADEDYEETRRFASITYSGVFRQQSNINKLNEFNLALANYKDIEQIFGSIQKMYGRQTDVLVLQEDKISYVLAGKNLLSDAAAGGSITSVPEVLGTQIARLEEYGISLNPESFASFGYEKYFTDSKRGALIKLTGSSYSNDQLEVISEYGMGSWFRDRFIETTDKQKLGAYDPFMDQYVLSIKDTPVEAPNVVLACGSFIDSAVFTDPMVFYLDAGTKTGLIQMPYTVGLIAGALEFKATFNGVVTTSGAVTSSGFLNVNKSTAYPNTVKVEVIPTSGGGNFELQINCP